MTEYTTTSLIEELEKFPKDTPIRTELAFIFNYNKDCCMFKDSMDEEEFLDYCKSNAVDVAIFEGSWEKDRISDLNNIMPEYVEDWYTVNATYKERFNRIKDHLQEHKCLTLNEFLKWWCEE